MKTNEAPEKIYVKIIHPFSEEYTQIIGFENGRGIEYTRTNAFIKKAVEFIKNSTYGYLTYKNGDVDLDREALANDFRKAMKGK